MRARRLIFSAKPSRCCGCRSVFVRSRDDGFVTRGCLKCGKTDPVKECEIPSLACEHCDLPKESITVSVIDKRYVYRCDECGRQWQLAEVLPHWAELFQYCGLRD